MLRTVEAIIDPQGHILWGESIQLKAPQRVLVTLLENKNMDESLIIAESSLAKEWLNEDEEAAWKHLQPGV